MKAKQRLSAFPGADSAIVAEQITHPMNSTRSIHPSILHTHRTAYRRATGMPFSVSPPGAPRPPPVCGRTFCALIGGTPTGCARCQEAHGELKRLAESQGQSAHAECFAGLTELAVPVVSDGRHVATLWSGQVFRRVPSEEDFVRASAPFRSELCPGGMHEARLVYFARPVFTNEQWHHAMGMLHDIASDFGDQTAHAPDDDFSIGSSAVAKAKRYVQGNLTQPFTPAEVAEHIHLNQSYFCRLFRRETQLTLGEYIARSRVERALELLATTAMRSTEIAHAAGFGSIQRFNALFKRYVGLSPSAFRGSRPTGSGISSACSRPKVNFRVE
jgi:AraC-like DNA-binding protein